MIDYSKLSHFKHKNKFDIFLIDSIAVLSILYLILLITDLYVTAPIFGKVIIIFDTILSSIFFFEFFYFLFKSENKTKYSKENFTDLLASVPILLMISISPAFYLFNIFKLLRGLQNILIIYEFVIKRRLSLLIKIFTMFTLVVIYFSLIIVSIERSSNGQLETFHDGIWWAVSTITSVGYGDVTPNTYSGKITAILLMIFGIGISSAVGALFVAWLLSPAQEKIYGQELKISMQEKEISKREKEIGTMERKILKRLDKIEEKFDKK